MTVEAIYSHLYDGLQSIRVVIYVDFEWGPGPEI